MTIQRLPERPNHEQLKRQAKDLLRSARTQDPTSLARFRALPAHADSTDAELERASLALHDAQSVIAREHGFVSWNALRERVEELTLDAGAAAEQFVEASTDGRTERAERLLALHPGIPEASFHAALALGRADLVEPRLADGSRSSTCARRRSGGVPGPFPTAWW